MSSSSGQRDPNPTERKSGPAALAEILRQLPRVDALLEHEVLARQPWERKLCHRAIVEVLAELRADLRARVESGEQVIGAPSLETCAHEVALRLHDWLRIVPRKVINASGTLLHTNIGRAPLSQATATAMLEAAGCCDLEIDLKSGQRGSRMTRLCRLFSRLCAAEDVLVVNNGAAAILLVCTALAASPASGRRGVALSRGQMVEIGDGFRVATMMAAGGVPVIEIGSTNRTHVADYERVLAEGWTDAEGRAQPGVALLSWVHASNFSQSGFVKDVGLVQLAELAHRHDVPLVADLGSGSLGKGVPEEEPTVLQYIEQGADLVTFSGDKLLGGPQAGVIAGKAEFIARCRRHPMARALRPDKTTVAGLHATLVAHARKGCPDLPLPAMISRDVASLQARGQAMLRDLGWRPEQLVPSRAVIGGGSLPGRELDSRALVCKRSDASRRAAALRLREPAVLVTVRDDEIRADLRSLDPADDAALVQALREELDSDPGH